MNIGIVNAYRESYNTQKSSTKSVSSQQTSAAAKTDQTPEAQRTALLDELKREFPGYTFVSQNPKDVAYGQNLCYIDDENLDKMVKNPSYKAQVFGLMKREYTSGLTPIKVAYPPARAMEFTATGSVFSLCKDNPSEGGIPYKGMATCSSRIVDNPYGAYSSLDAFGTEVMRKGEAYTKEYQKKFNVSNSGTTASTSADSASSKSYADVLASIQSSYRQNERIIGEKRMEKEFLHRRAMQDQLEDDLYYKIALQQNLFSIKA